jgi:hypothetical protein
MDFDTWMAEAWNRHAEAPAAVLADIAGTGAALATDDAAVGRLLHLAHHVAGAHPTAAADRAAGRALLARLATLPSAGDTARASAALYDRALALTGGDASASAGLPPAQAVRVAALAAANLAEHEPARAGALLEQAVATAQAHPLPDTDPAVRALAVAGNNIASALHELPARDATTTALMLQAAGVGLVFWRRAGTWLEEERAHHRLAVCAAAAGDAALAREHAQACAAIVAREGDVALEAFFAHEAAALAEAAAGDSTARAQAVARARAAFERLDADDQAWCRATLLELGAPLP